MLTRINKLFLSSVLVAGMLSAAAFAGSEPSPQELLAKSFQQANLWNQGPVKLVAKMRRPAANGQELNRQLTVYWAGTGKVACGVERSPSSADHHPQPWQVVVRQ